MKTSNWIRIIGILCIIFGITGLIDNILPFLFSELNDSTGEVAQNPPGISIWFMINKYSGIFVRAFYLLAGIFFLLKKPFSIWLMYFALTINIMYVLITMIIAELYNSIIFVLPGLFIDIALLIFVYRIRKFYFESPDEIVIALGAYSPKPTVLKIFTFIGFICFSISISILWLWINAFNSGKNQGDSVAIFKSHFPVFLQNGYNISYFSLILCILAIAFSSLSLKSDGFLWKVNMIILVLSSLLFLLNLFQLM
jgi:hypothetical protein